MQDLANAVNHALEAFGYPTHTVRAIERYLASGVIKGIGPALAKRIVKRFKGDALRVMEEEPETLAQVKGISANGARLMQEQVAAKREMRDAMMFLEQFGISVPLAVEDSPPAASEAEAFLALELFSLARVFGPTSPSTLSPLRFWKFLTAVFVPLP